MAEEFICNTAEIRSFIGEVKEIVAGAASVEERLVAIRPLQLANGRPLLVAQSTPPHLRKRAGWIRAFTNWLLYRETRLQRQAVLVAVK